MSNSIEIVNLEKIYGKTRALDSLNLSITQNGIVGLFGPNGSGKTTMIKILASLLKQYDGSAKINGLKPGFKTKSIVSCLPDRTYLDLKKKVKYAVNLFSDFYLDFDKELTLNLLGRFNINLEFTIKSLSKGNCEKLQTILTIARKAKIYLFDEPIAGVAPASREVIFKLITEYCSKDSIIILTTHLIMDVEDIVDQAVFINNGKVVFNEYMDDLR